MTYLQTYNSGIVDFLEPTSAMIDPDALAHHLALINRFAGATSVPWSVAAHSLLLAELMALDGAGPRMRLFGLLHDAHEAYTGDLTSPFKCALQAECPGAHNAINAIQDRLDRVIFPAFGLAPMPTGAERSSMRYYDLLALGLESRKLLPRGPEKGLADYLDSVVPSWRDIDWPEVVPRTHYIDIRATWLGMTKYLAGRL